MALSKRTKFVLKAGLRGSCFGSLLGLIGGGLLIAYVMHAAKGSSGGLALAAVVFYTPVAVLALGALFGSLTLGVGIVQASWIAEEPDEDEPVKEEPSVH